MGIEWIFIGTTLAVFAFCLFRWIAFGYFFGGNKFVHFFRGLLTFIISFALITGLHLLLMDAPYIDRFYYDPDLQLANVIFVSATMAVFVIVISEFFRNRLKRKSLTGRGSEINTIGTDDN